MVTAALQKAVEVVDQIKRQKPINTEESPEFSIFMERRNDIICDILALCSSLRESTRYLDQVASNSRSQDASHRDNTVLIRFYRDLSQADVNFSLTETQYAEAVARRGKNEAELKILEQVRRHFVEDHLDNLPQYDTKYLSLKLDISEQGVRKSLARWTKRFPKYLDLVFDGNRWRIEDRELARSFLSFHRLDARKKASPKS